MTELEKKMGFTYTKLASYLCCENCYKHYVMALAPLDNILDVKQLHDAIMSISQRKRLPVKVQHLFDLKFTKIGETLQ
jgi:prolyl-tRNA editing enzyme YbaK/EbsC (Cys-tRNA(Pro) deacylase)